MTIPIEPIGSIPRTPELIRAFTMQDCDDPSLAPLYEAAIRDTVARFEATGSPVVTDGEQRKYHNFWTYPVHGLANTAPDGFVIPFAAGHARRMPRLTAGPFRYKRGAAKVQIDFTEGRLAIKIDPAGNLLNSFIDLNNVALARFSTEERARIGVHTCPGGDRDSTHRADVVFVGVIAPIDPRVETPQEVRDSILEAAGYIPPDRLGTTDDCGFSPFSDDISTSRDTTFEKIRARVLGTARAAEFLGVA
jgi:5-methyltetrahydropteroyltriglutamate--homocysteine methyltransferase